MVDFRAVLDEVRQLPRDALREQGVGPGCTVALSATRSASLVVGMLGILKAGAAYVPIDAGDPPERVTYMLENSGAGAVVVEAGCDGAFARR